MVCAVLVCKGMSMGMGKVCYFVVSLAFEYDVRLGILAFMEAWNTLSFCFYFQRGMFTMIYEKQSATVGIAVLHILELFEDE
jgi:hypothetical protein